MGYEMEVIRRFDKYCSEERERISQIKDTEQNACRQKVLVARCLLYHEASYVMQSYKKYTSVANAGSEGKVSADKEGGMQFGELQEAVLGALCAGLEDTSFNKWKLNLIDAVEVIQSMEQTKKMPRFSKACEDVTESLDIEFSDVEEELRVLFEPECIYNTLVLVVTLVKCYRETVENVYEKNRRELMKKMDK